MDWIWLETTLRSALLADGRRILEQVLALVPEPAFEPEPGQRTYRQRECQILSLFGPLSFRRTYYQRTDQAGVCPKDQAVRLMAGCTPAAARILCRSVARLAYRESQVELQELAGIEVPASYLQRLALEIGPRVLDQLPKVSGPPLPEQATFYVSVDGTGVPMVKSEVADRAGKEPGQSAKTREIKLAALFTQTELDEEERPVRNEKATTYAASFSVAADFGLLVRQAAQSRKISRAQRVVCLGDGAAWIWELARVNFPGAIEILDYFHACEHVTDLARLVYTDAGSANNFAIRWKSLLYDSELEAMLAEIDQVVGPTASKDIAREIEYFRSNRARMDYKRFRAEGLFIGSGVVEAGCKRIVGQRLKNSGMHWTVPGAAAIAALRCASLSDGTWNQVWDALLPEIPRAA